MREVCLAGGYYNSANKRFLYGKHVKKAFSCISVFTLLSTFLPFYLEFMYFFPIFAAETKYIVEPSKQTTYGDIAKDIKIYVKHPLNLVF